MRREWTIEHNIALMIIGAFLAISIAINRAWDNDDLLIKNDYCQYQAMGTSSKLIQKCRK